MARADLDDFVACYQSGRRRDHAATERFKCFAHAELVARDKVNLDIFWLKDDALGDPTCCRRPTRSPRRSSRTWKPRSTASAKSR